MFSMRGIARSSCLRSSHNHACFSQKLKVPLSVNTSSSYTGTTPSLCLVLTRSFYSTTASSSVPAANTSKSIRKQQSVGQNLRRIDSPSSLPNNTHTSKSEVAEVPTTRRWDGVGEENFLLSLGFLRKTCTSLSSQSTNDSFYTSLPSNEEGEKGDQEETVVIKKNILSNYTLVNPSLLWRKRHDIEALKKSLLSPLSSSSSSSSAAATAQIALKRKSFSFASTPISLSPPCSSSSQPPPVGKHSEKEKRMKVIVSGLADVLAIVAHKQAFFDSIRKEERREAARWEAIQLQRKLKVMSPSQTSPATKPNHIPSSLSLSSAGVADSPSSTCDDANNDDIDTYVSPAGPSIVGSFELVSAIHAVWKEVMSSSANSSSPQGTTAHVLPTIVHYTGGGAEVVEGNFNASAAQNTYNNNNNNTYTSSTIGSGEKIHPMPTWGIQGLILRNDLVPAWEKAEEESAAEAKREKEERKATAAAAAISTAKGQTDALLPAGCMEGERAEAQLALLHEIEKMTDALNTSQRSVLDFALKGYSMFLGGDAGTGKSFLLRVIIAHLRDRLGLNVAVTGATGIAALNIGGVTFHSLFGAGIGSFSGGVDSMLYVPSTHRYKAKSKAKSRLHASLRDIDVLIVDEVSMLSERDLSALAQAAGEARGEATRTSGTKRSKHCSSKRSKKDSTAIPMMGRGGDGSDRTADNQLFGGMQVIFCGDFMQLKAIEGDNTNNGKGTSIMSMKSIVGTETQSLFNSPLFARGGLRLVAPRPPSTISSLSSHSPTPLSPLSSPSPSPSPSYEGGLLHIRLTEVMRQGGDTEFLDALNKLRVGELTPMIVDSATLNPFYEGATRLYGRRVDADRFNKRMMDLIEAPAVNFPAKVTHSNMNGSAVSDVAIFDVKLSASTLAAAAGISATEFPSGELQKPTFACGAGSTLLDANTVAVIFRETAHYLCLSGTLERYCERANVMEGSERREKSLPHFVSLVSSALRLQPDTATANGDVASSGPLLDFFVVKMKTFSPSSPSASRRKGRGGGKALRMRFCVRCSFRGLGDRATSTDADRVINAVLSFLSSSSSSSRGNNNTNNGISTALTSSPHHTMDLHYSPLPPRLSLMGSVTVIKSAKSEFGGGDQYDTTNYTSRQSGIDMDAVGNPLKGGSAGEGSGHALHDMGKRITDLARGELTKDSSLGLKTLKIGCKVMLLRNITPQLVNGRQGMVIGMEEMDPHSPHFTPLRSLFKRIRVAASTGLVVTAASTQAPAGGSQMEVSSLSTKDEANDTYKDEGTHLKLATDEKNGGEVLKGATEVLVPPKKEESKSIDSIPNSEKTPPPTSSPLPFLTVLVPTNRALSPWHLNMPVPIVRFDDGSTSYIPYAQLPLAMAAETCSSSITTYVATVPLLPGYAFTVHKIQGLTLSEPIVVDCRSMWPCEHIIYVAASRVKKFEHLRIVGLRKDLVLVDKDALRFTLTCPTVEETLRELQALPEGRTDSTPPPPPPPRSASASAFTPTTESCGSTDGFPQHIYPIADWWVTMKSTL